MNYYYDINSLDNFDNEILSYEYQFDQFRISKIVKDNIDCVITTNIDKNKLNILKPIIVNVVTNYLNIANKLECIKKTGFNYKINKKKSIIANSILEDSIIENDYLLNQQIKNYNKYKSLKSIKNFININTFSKIYNYVIFSESELSESFLKNKKYCKINVNNLFPVTDFNIKKSQNLAIEIIEKINQDFSNGFFKLRKNQILTLVNIIKQQLNRLYYNIEFNNINYNFKNVIISNSQNYYNRLLAYILKNKCENLYGFDHGGDKIFYKYNYYYKNELEYVKTYVSYSNKYINHLNKIKGNNIELLKGASSYNNNLYKKFFNKNLKKNKKIVLLISAMSGEKTGNIYDSAVDDINKINWSFKVKKYLNKKKFNYKIKLHPKSRLKNISKLFNYNELINLSLENLFTESDIYIIDYLGTTLMECLCAGKEVIFFDHGVNNFNEKFKNELSKVIHVIPITYKNNKLKFDFDLFEYALNNEKNTIDVKNTFIKDYYL